MGLIEELIDSRLETRERQMRYVRRMLLTLARIGVLGGKTMKYLDMNITPAQWVQHLEKYSIEYGRWY